MENKYSKIKGDLTPDRISKGVNKKVIKKVGKQIGRYESSLLARSSFFMFFTYTTVRSGTSKESSHFLFYVYFREGEVKKGKMKENDLQ